MYALLCVCVGRERGGVGGGVEFLSFCLFVCLVFVVFVVVVGGVGVGVVVVLFCSAINWLCFSFSIYSTQKQLSRQYPHKLCDQH